MFAIAFVFAMAFALVIAFAVKQITPMILFIFMPNCASAFALGSDPGAYQWHNLLGTVHTKHSPYVSSTVH